MTTTREAAKPTEVEITPARQRLIDLKATMPMRDDLTCAMFAAWLGVSVEKLPGDFKQFDNPETVAAWRRVADAARAALATPATKAQGYVDAFAVFDPNWGEPKPVLSTIRATSNEAIDAALWTTDCQLYSGAAFHCTPPLKGNWDALQRHGYRVGHIYLAARPAPQPAADTRVVAAALWHEEAVNAGAPNSVAAGRTLASFLEQSPELQARWTKFAACAIRALAGQGETP